LFRVYITAASTLSVDTYDATGANMETQTLTGSVTASQWHWVAASLFNFKWYIYLDGGLTGSFADKVTYYNMTTPAKTSIRVQLFGAT